MLHIHADVVLHRFCCVCVLLADSPRGPSMGVRVLRRVGRLLVLFIKGLCFVAANSLEEEDGGHRSRALEEERVDEEEEEERVERMCIQNPAGIITMGPNNGYMNRNSLCGSNEYTNVVPTAAMPTCHMTALPRGTAHTGGEGPTP